MYKVSVQSLNECFNVDGDDFLFMDDTDIEPSHVCRGVRSGCKHSEESKHQISQSKRGVKWSEKTRKSRVFFVSEEQKAKMSQSRCKFNYTLELPNGEQIEVTNLKKFALENGFHPYRLSKKGVDKGCKLVRKKQRT